MIHTRIAIRCHTERVKLMDQAKIGKFIAQKRKEHNLTQRELAELLGVGDKAVSKWECGRGMPDNTIMLPLCNILDINVNELLSGESLSEKNYSEKAEGIIMTLMEEKEVLKKRNRIRNVISIICVMVMMTILISNINMWVEVAYGWSTLNDPSALITDCLVVLVIMTCTGTVRTFFRSFRLIRKGAEVDEMMASLWAIKLAMTSFLLGGGLLTVICMIVSLVSTEGKVLVRMAISLANLLYGLLFALILLPVKAKLEAELEANQG